MHLGLLGDPGAELVLKAMCALLWTLGEEETVGYLGLGSEGPCQPWGALPGFCFEEGLPSTTGEHWTAASLRVKKFDIVFISAYLESGVGLNETNVRRLTQLADFIKCLRVPFVIMADWNIEPSELVATGWDRFVQGTVVAPRDVTFTCNQGKGRMLDYAVVANSLVPYFSLQVDPDSPWSPHVGLTVSFAQKILDQKIFDRVSAAKRIYF